MKTIRPAGHATPVSPDPEPAGLPPLAIVALITLNVVSPSAGLTLGLAAALLALDGLGWRAVAAMFDRERLVTGGRT